MTTELSPDQRSIFGRWAGLTLVASDTTRALRKLQATLRGEGNYSVADHLDDIAVALEARLKYAGAPDPATNTVKHCGRT